MSECVVRMERVPKNCDDGCWGSLSGECPWCDSVDRYKMIGNRPPNCSIIAVLPEGHGRLGDLDAVFYSLAKQETIDGQPRAIRRAMRIIEREPTIVPAERSET